MLAKHFDKLEPIVKHNQAKLVLFNTTVTIISKIFI